MVVGKASRRGSQSAAPSKKRSRDEMDKINGQLTGTQIKPVNLDDYQGNEYEKPEKAIRAKKSKPQLSVEKRLRKVRSRAPIAWQERLERAINQR